jgi:hypothetical protein
MISQSTIVRDHSTPSLGSKSIRGSATYVINMTPKFPNCNLTDEDRLTYANWMRAMAAFYGCVALLLLGGIVLTKTSSLSLATGKHSMRQATTRPVCRPNGGIPAPTSRGKRDEDCSVGTRKA